MLDSLVDIGDIEPEKAEYGREKYLEIHTALIQSMRDETHLLDQAKNLHQMLDVGHQVYPLSTTIYVLRADDEYS